MPENLCIFTTTPTNPLKLEEHTMPKIAYEKKEFTKPTLRVIKAAMDIIAEYRADGFTLTLRQLYYQFVARDLIANKQREYNRLGRIISDARMAGFIDWNAIEDRTRYMRGNSHWSTPASVIKSAAQGYRIDMWKNQPVHIEVWIEKDALVGVLENVCTRLDLPYFSCRGYVSASEMWSAGRRLGEAHFMDDKQPIILHLGDHDPSGIDMTRDIERRLNDFAVEPEYRAEGWDDEELENYNREHIWPVQVERIALSMEQIRELNPPPNPAKITDSRYAEYRKKYGESSWELDALEPRYIERLIEEAVATHRDGEQWAKDMRRWKTDTEQLKKISDNYDSVQKFVDEL